MEEKINQLRYFLIKILEFRDNDGQLVPAMGALGDLH